jgi:hypothetical protein
VITDYLLLGSIAANISSSQAGQDMDSDRERERERERERNGSSPDDRNLEVKLRNMKTGTEREELQAYLQLV